MLADQPIVAFASTTDLARARAFYEGTLGLEVRFEDEFAVVLAAHGASIRVTLVEHLTPQPFTILGWQVDDIGAAVRELAAAGVAFERFDFFDQDDDGIWSAPGGGRIAWFKDPDGNTLSLGQSP
jgi:catechol 2,3-dioxygenase-like lactoylglutathione lyase family enzyme